MNFKNLILKNISFFTRYYHLVAIAVIVAVGVIVGSLVIGDSVRTTLVKRVAERLCKTETVVFSQYSFFDKTILQTSLLADNSRGVLLSNGFLSISGKLIPVTVWGVDNMAIEKGHLRINKALEKELQTTIGQELVLRLPATGMVPSGSLFVTDTYTTSLRLTLDSVMDVESGGNISLKNEQSIPYNVFVNQSELATTLEIEGKINVILSENVISKTDLDSIWNYSISGLKVKQMNDFAEISSDRIFIQKQVVETVCKNNASTSRQFSYLANSIGAKHRSIPYSFVTAVDSYNGRNVSSDEIILSDYAAKRLSAAIDDTITISYFTSQNLKTLVVDSVKLKVSQIVPLAQLQADSTLSADFPGLSNVERCTDWNSDLPIDMKQITNEDEDYWAKYKNTPKVILPYKAVASDWANSYGSATAIRVDSGDINLEGLMPEMFDIQLIHPREAGITAAKSGVDFSSLFLSLGFFIIVSAMLLMLVPLSEMLFQRQDELDLLKSLGYSRKRIIGMLWTESAPVVSISSVVGVLVGLAYTYFILFLLGTVWQGATHTEGFAAYPDGWTILIGLVVGIVLSMILLRIAIVRQLKEKKVAKAKKLSTVKKKLIIALLFTFVLIVLALFNLIYLKATVLFVCIGITFIVSVWYWIDYTICRLGSSNTLFDFSKLLWAKLFAARKQAILSFFTLAIGVFTVFSVGLNRQGFADSSQLLTGTGGYSLWCESSVPIYHNVSSEEGRTKLALTDLPPNTQVMQLYKYSADDASCLNLNKVTNPSVLGIDMHQLKESDFRISNSIYSDNVFDKLQESTDSVHPALIDETVLLWGLGKSLGDTLVYEGEKGRQITIQLVGTLQNSIFQGNILIDKKLFSEIWSEISGSELMLVKVPENEIVATKMLMSQALSNYGVMITTTNERLQLFYSVTDTYLTIFLTLGGLGLLLGIMSFIIVVRKNLASRSNEIALYRSLGFTDKRMERLLYRENIIIPFSAIVTGVVGSLLGVSMGFANVSLWIWLLAIVLACIFVASVLLFIRISVHNCLNEK